MVYSTLHNREKMNAYRIIAETAFYGNNVHRVGSVAEAYYLAKNSPGTIVTDIPIFNPEYHGLPRDAKILVFNDGAVVGRAAQARRIAYTPGVEEKTYCDILTEAVYQMRFRKFYHGEAVIGLHPEFMVKAHLLISEGFENNLLSWLLNFQAFNSEYEQVYKNSRPIDDLEILVISDPLWSHPDFPIGLAFFDPLRNVAFILGMRYFGEHKKGTLTLAWGIANRHGYASCHGGLKRYDNEKFVAGFFGLSGSGKSSLTHARHSGKFKITIVHDDAFIVNMNDGSSIALEPAYFDKTSDYKIGDPDNKYILTAQNIGVGRNEKGEMFLITEDIRNGNGRAIKSKLWSPNRIDRIDDPINAIFWLMKDPALPPVVRLENSVIASTLGTTLATKRTSAERRIGEDINKLVVEPYANPFRTYPLKEDYFKFKELFEKRRVKCYIFNTGHFLDKKVPKELTLSLLEDLAQGKDNFVPWGKLEGLSYVPVDGFVPPMNDSEYRSFLKSRILDRLEFVRSREEATKGFDTLPDECAECLRKLAESIG